MTAARMHYRACNLCEAICGIAIETDPAGEIVAIRGDRDDPFSRGHICPKAVALQDVHRDPDRLRHPVRRTDGGFVRISWDEAFDRVAERLRGVRRDHGRDAVAVFLGNPTVHNYGSLLFGIPLLRALRTRNRFSATSVDQLPHHVVAFHLFGHQLLLPIPDIDRTDHLLIIGANPAVSNGSMLTAPGMKKRIERIRARGGTVVVIDPRRTRTAALADRHFFIRPGTDALLLAAMVRSLIDEGRVDLGTAAGFVDGVEAVGSGLAPFTPERVAEAVGIEAPDIRRLARDLAAAPSAVCYGRIGTCVQRFGGLTQWLITVLNTISGNLDRPGGVLFSEPAVDPIAAGASPGSRGRWHSRVRALPEFGGELPVAVLAEEIETEGDGRIRALITSAGNPVLSTPNGGRLERALPRLDFMVSIDYYVNETTRFADIILPPTGALEHDHYDVIFNALAVRNVARYSPPLTPPANGCRHDWQILAELERRLGPRHPRARIARAVRRRLGPRGMLALMLRFGPRGGRFNPFGGGLTLGRLARAEHGLDLGPLWPTLPARLSTATKRVDLAAGPFLADLDRLAAALTEARSPLVLVSRRSVRSNNSWLHNSRRLMRGRDRCTLQIHPRDAERAGLADGDRATVRSRTGTVSVPVAVTDGIMPGVVCLPHGWGHDRAGVRLSVAAERPGASVNDLTDDRLVDPLTGNAALSGVPVDVEPAP